MNKYTVVGPCRWGWYCGLAADFYQSRSIYHYGEWSKDGSDMMYGMLEKGDTVVDVGANVGTLTMGFAHAVGDKGQVIAIEAQRIPYLCLCANVAMNSLLHIVDPVLAAASDTVGTIDVPVFKLTGENQNVGGMSLLDKHEGETTPTRCITIDSLNLTSCNLIKADVEGMEANVLRGAKQTIEKCRPVIFAEALDIRPGTKESLVSVLREIGYKSWMIYPRVFSPRNIRMEEINIYADQCEPTALALPEEWPTPDWITPTCAKLT